MFSFRNPYLEGLTLTCTPIYEIYHPPTIYITILHVLQTSNPHVKYAKKDWRFNVKLYDGLHKILPGVC